MTPENCTMGTKTQTPIQATTETLHRNLRIINEMSETIVERLRGPQLEKADQGCNPVAPGLLGTMNDYNDTAEGIIKKLSLVLETL